MNAIFFIKNCLRMEGTLATRLSCECTPGKVFSSKASLKTHYSSLRHSEFALRCEVRALRLRLAESEACVARLRTDVQRLGSYIRNPATRKVSARTKKEVAAGAGWTCQSCSRMVSENYEVDHRVPLCLGGTNERGNLQLLCPECHRTKTARERVGGGSQPYMSECEPSGERP